MAVENVFNDLMKGVNIKMLNVNKNTFQKNFKTFLKNISHIYDGKFNYIRTN